MSKRSAAAFLAQHRKACGAHNDGKLRRPEYNSFNDWADEHALCQRGCGNEASPEHTCPFNYEIRPSDKKYCNCCPDCAHECAMDI